jgi:hypothetical protein
MNAGRGGAGSRSQISYYQNIYRNATTALRKAQEADAVSGTAETRAALQAARAAEAKARRDYEAASLGQDFEAPTGGVSDPTQMSDEELLAALNQ